MSILEETTSARGLPVTAEAWPAGQFALAEISPGALALFDADGDGDLDLYVVRHPPPDRPQDPAPNTLLWNAGGRFETAAASGLEDPGYGHGVAVGDFDSDGAPDVFVANLGRDGLYRNRGDGTFEDVTERAGVTDDSWSSCAAFFDYDRDGDLDLFVTRYLLDDPSRVCRTARDAPRDYCGPTRYVPIRDSLYQNDGGRFSEVSAAAGIRDAQPGFGLVCLDLTGDGWPDVYVANDMRPNHLHVNRHDGTFAEEALARGVAVSGAGSPQSSMGVAVGDLDEDGRWDIFLTHLVDQTNTLYLSGGAEGRWMDRSATSGLGAPSLPFTSWGCQLVDLDHDGDQDLLVVSGRVARGPILRGASLGSFWDAYAEPSQIFENFGGGRFKDVSATGGDFTRRIEVTHSLATGDLDGDGDLDAVTIDVGGHVRVYDSHASESSNHWLRVRALTGQRDALGAVVIIESGGRRQMRPLITSQGFASASEPVAHFGLGGAQRVDVLEVRWPDGRTERFVPPPVDRLVTLLQGSGERRP